MKKLLLGLFFAGLVLFGGVVYPTTVSAVECSGSTIAIGKVEYTLSVAKVKVTYNLKGCQGRFAFFYANDSRGFGKAASSRVQVSSNDFTHVQEYSFSTTEEGSYTPYARIYADNSSSTSLDILNSPSKVVIKFNSGCDLTANVKTDKTSYALDEDIKVTVDAAIKPGSYCYGQSFKRKLYANGTDLIQAVASSSSTVNDSFGVGNTFQTITPLEIKFKPLEVKINSATKLAIRFQIFYPDGNRKDFEHTVNITSKTVTPNPGSIKPFERGNDSGNGNNTTPGPGDNVIGIPGELQLGSSTRAQAGELMNPIVATNLIALMTTLMQGLAAGTVVWAVIFILVSSFKLVVSQGESDKIKDAKETIVWSLAGIVVTVLAYSIVSVVLNIINAGVK